MKKRIFIFFIVLLILNLISVFGIAGTNIYAQNSIQAQVDLSLYFNNDAFSYDSNRSDGNFDSGGYTYSADLINTNVTVKGATFKLGPMSNGSNNNIKCLGQTIDVPASQYSSIRIIGAASNGGTANCKNGTFRMIYTDGTSSEGSLRFIDWWCSDANIIASTRDYGTPAQVLAHCHNSTSDVGATVRMNMYYLTPLPGKTLKSIIFPNVPDIHVFAITGFIGAYVNLSGDFNEDILSIDSNKADGNIDGFNNTISGDLLKDANVYDNAEYVIGSTAAEALNAVKCNGQSLYLPKGQFESLRFAATSTNGNQPATFRVYYTDGTYLDTVFTVKDWLTTNTAGEKVILSMSHMHTQTADNNTINTLFGFYITLNTAKTVTKIVLPNNGNVHLFAITLLPKDAVPVSLSSYFNGDGFSYDTLRSNGSFDANNYTYSADLMSSSLTYEGVIYNFGSMTNSSNNMVKCSGQNITISQGRYSSVRMLVAGSGEQTGTFRINYTDGTYTDVPSINVKDWWNNTLSINAAASFTHSHTPTADIAAPVRMFPAYFNTDPFKTVSGITLPNNTNIRIFAITAVPTGEIATPVPNPRVLSTTYTSEDVPVCIFSVSDSAFGAIPNDDLDDTESFQRALDAAGIYGGGVVFAPIGRYKFLGHLSIPANVTLRGEWVNPDTGSGAVQGTILMPYEGKDNLLSAPFISIDRASVVRDLSIWYPEQNDINNVHAYPYTIRPKTNTTYGLTVRNVTLVNSYQAISSNYGSCDLIKSVYITALKQGIYTSNTGDVERLQTVCLRPKYWANSGLGTPPSESSIKNFTQTSATGITYVKCDWFYAYDLYIEGYNTGFFMDENVYGNTSGQMEKIRIEGAVTGIKVTNIIYPWINAVLISDAIVNVEGTGSKAVYVSSAYNYRATITFNNCTFSSPNGVPFMSDGEGIMNLVHCTFTDWSSGNRAIEMNNGTLVAEACTFQVDKPDIYLASNVDSATILANNFANNTPSITNNSAGDVKIDYTWTPSRVPQMPTTGPNVITSYRKPSNNNFFNVMTYGATANGTTDDTGAFQSALNAAQTAGGGTVYVPAGRYKISTHLSVPTNVELRGSSDGPHFYGMEKRGSTLVAYEDQNNASGTPFISLSSNSGVRGISVFYPNQWYNSIQSYPATVQLNGSGAYIIDLTLPDSYNGIKITAGNYYIDYARGLALNKFIEVTNTSMGGNIQDVHATVGDWQNLVMEDNAPPQDWWSGDSGSIHTPACNTGTTIEINDSSNVNLFNNFSFAVGTGIKVTGNSSNILSYGEGHDDVTTGALFTGTGINNIFVNSTFSAFKENKNYIKTDTTFSGNIKFFNSASTANQNGSEFRGSGNVTLQQLCDLPWWSSNPPVKYIPVISQYGGTLWMDSCVLKRDPNQVYIDAAIVDTQIYANVGITNFGVDNRKGDPDVWMNIRK